LPAGSKFDVLRSEIRGSQRVIEHIDRDLPSRQGTNLLKQVGITLFMECSDESISCPLPGDDLGLLATREETHAICKRLAPL
jgi:hypothetical protein